MTSFKERTTPEPSDYGTDSARGTPGTEGCPGAPGTVGSGQL
jgi:hypothetical protein